MKALFLAGGQGTRLRPLTNQLPKPMVPIMGKPLLERNILKLKNSDIGLEEIVISTCYKPQKIESYFGNGQRYDLEIRYVWEKTPRGTGGAIKNTEDFFDTTFLIFNADILSDIDYRDLLKYHQEKAAHVTIAVTSVENPSMYGVVEFDADGYALSFREKPKPQQITSNYINAGVYVFEPEVLKEIAPNREVSVEKEVFPLLLQKGYRVAVYKYSSYWLDIGTPKKYYQAHEDIFKGKYPIAEVSFSKQNIYEEQNVYIHTSARIRGPVYIGNDVTIGANSLIGPNVVIGENSKIGESCKISNSVIWDEVSVGNGALLTGTIIVSGSRINSKEKYTNLIYTEDSSLQLAV